MLHLTPEQKQQVLLQRTAHLSLMRRIYQQRQQLNMQAGGGWEASDACGHMQINCCSLPDMWGWVATVKGGRLLPPSKPCSVAACRLLPLL